MTIDKIITEEADGDWHIYAHDKTFGRMIFEIIPEDQSRMGMPPTSTPLAVHGIPYCDSQHASESWHGSTCWELHPLTSFAFEPISATPTQEPPSSTQPAPTAGPLSLSAIPSTGSPCQYSTVTIVVEVRDANDASVAGADVSSSWHYKTTVSNESGTTDTSGKVLLSRGISRATAGYTVIVDIVASVNGITGSTSTSFTPRAC